MHKRIDLSDYRTRLTLLFLLMLTLFGIMATLFFKNNQTNSQLSLPQKSAVTTTSSPTEPSIATQEILQGLSHPWDIVFLPDGTALFNERGGTVSRIENGEKKVIMDISDVYSAGEGGLTGLTLDSNFKENRFLYTCFNARTASGIDVRVVRWRLSDDNASLSNREDIVTGIPSSSSGRHSGCRARSDKTGNLWIGTGDAASATNPQDPKSLGGKILHITRDGMPAPGNLPAPFDPRIFSYGHRNVQGIVLFDEPKNDVYGYSIEHGSDRDDEINLLKSGNFGWAPRGTYVERGVPMTDTSRFPEAVSAIWSSGSPTIAPSGGTLLSGNQWGTWNGAVAMAVLKNRQVRIMQFDSAYKFIQEKQILEDFGRIRSVAQGLDGNMYITTDNGRNDKIIKVTPSGN